MPASIPQVEIVSGPGHSHPPVATPWYRARRVQVFLGTFFLILLIGQAINFARSALYRSSATVLTVAPPAVDESAQVSELDVQHVAIQRQLLLGRPLLEQVLTRLRNTGDAERHALRNVDDFQAMLTVAPVPSTHLVEMSADGPVPELLPRLVNSWIESYLAYREEAIHQEVGDTLGTLREEYAEQAAVLEAKRRSIDAFREQHDILTEDRLENQAHNRLAGLNSALNKAREKVVESRARLKGLQTAIEQGEAVVPDSEKSGLATLQREAQALRGKLKVYEKRFTRHYMQVEPEFQKLPAELREKEQTIERTIRIGQQQLLTDARQQLLSATEAVMDLENQLFEHKKAAAEFSSRFAEYTAMQEDLAGLEELHRSTEQRMAGIESKSLEKYPQVRVVDWAYAPTEPLHPQYMRDALVITLGALILGIIAVWMTEYLRHAPRPEPPSGALSGIRIYSEQPALQPGTAAPGTLARQDRDPPTLAPSHLRELTRDEVAALWHSADEPGQRLIGLLLSGLTLREAGSVGEQDFDPARRLLHISGASPRSLPLAPTLTELLAQPTLAAEEARAALHIIGHDAGLPRPEELTPESLRHSYILYLVRQGARLRDLPRFIGDLPAQTLAGYAAYSPSGPGRPLAELETVYPLPGTSPERHDAG